MNKMISLFSAALLATVFAASCGKTLATCADAKTQEVCKDSANWAQGVFCKWEGEGEAAKCVVDDAAKTKAEAIAAAKTACEAVPATDIDPAKCTAAVTDAAHGKCELKATTDTKCTFTEPASN